LTGTDRGFSRNHGLREGVGVSFNVYPAQQVRVRSQAHPLLITLGVFRGISGRNFECRESTSDLDVEVALKVRKSLDQSGLCTLALCLRDLINPMILNQGQPTENEKKSAENPQSPRNTCCIVSSKVTRD
jgi:hypothetical protein